MRPPPKTTMSLPGSRLSAGISSASAARDRRALFHVDLGQALRVDELRERVHEQRHRVVRARPAPLHVLVGAAAHHDQPDLAEQLEVGAVAAVAVVDGAVTARREPVDHPVAARDEAVERDRHVEDQLRRPRGHDATR